MLEKADITLGSILSHFKVNPQHEEDDVIDEDVVLLWGEERKIITGSDLLGLMMRGIAQNHEIRENYHQ